jgi:hypothetical protein
VHVKIANIEFEVKNTLPGVKKLFSQIDETMKEFQVHFSHLVVDGVEVTDAPLDYLKQNRKDIKEVEIFFLTLEQYIGQVIGIMDEFLKKALPALKEISDEFYARPNDESWSRLDACLNGISSLIGIINDLVSIPELDGKTTAFSSIGESIGLHLENLKNAANLEDYTLIADILRFELVVFLEKLDSAVAELERRCGNATC